MQPQPIHNGDLANLATQLLGLGVVDGSLFNNGHNLALSVTSVVAISDSAVTDQDTPAVVNVLANDVAPVGGTLSVVSVSQGAHGSVAINGDNTLTYTPQTGYYGSDAFTYTAADGLGGTAVAQVAMTVRSPVAPQTVSFQRGVAGYTGTVDTFVQENSPTANNATATSLNVDSDDPAGTGKDVQALLRFDNVFGASAGQVPLDAQINSAQLVLQVTNPGNSINLHRMLQAWTATATWSSLVGGVQADGVEAVTTADLATGSVATGVLTLNVTPSLTAWQTNPATNLGWAMLPTGSDGLDFYSSEGSTPPRLVVTFTPAAANTPPVANADSTVTDEDTPVAIAVLSNDTDADGDPLVVLSAANGQHGSVVVNAGSTVTYTPNANFHGPDSFTYTVGDGRGGTASATVTVEIEPINDPPVAQNDSATTNSGMAVTINVQANDSDVEGGALTTSLVTTPASGVAVVNGGGTVTYTPNAGFSGTDSFTYRVSDGALSSNTATVTITVTAVSPKFFTVDSTSDRTFRYQSNGALISSSTLSTTAPANATAKGIAASPDGATVWVIDANKSVYVYDAAGTRLGQWTTSGLKTPTGISVTGSDVWIVDSGTDRAYRFAGAANRLSGTVAATSSFALQKLNSNPQDIVTDGVTIWVVNSATADRVYVYQASNGAALGNWTIDSANTSPTGITLDPTGASQELWIADIRTDRVYEYTNARSRRSGSQVAAGNFALNSNNLNIEGIADPDGTLLSPAGSAPAGVSEETAVWWETPRAFAVETPAARPAPTGGVRPVAERPPVRSRPAPAVVAAQTLSDARPQARRPTELADCVDAIFADIEPLFDGLRAIDLAVE